MTATRGRLYSFALPLRAPLATAHGRVERREGFLVELQDAEGNQGYGEALPLPGFGGETYPRCQQALRAGLADLAGVALRSSPVAACAVECATLDLECRGRGVSLADSLGGGADAVEINALVSGETPDAVRLDVERLSPSGFRTWKLKVGAGSLEDDVSRTRALRESVGAAGRIRLDANGVWTEREALEALARFAEFDIELVEQPTPPQNLVALAAVRRASPIRIAADEAAIHPSAVRALLDAEAVDAIAIKLPVLGGPTRALELARAARKRGVDVYVTSFLDSSLGIAAALQVACVLGGTGAAHGLGTASLLARDIAAELPIADGAMRRPAGPGLGVVPDASALKLLAEVRR